MYIYIYYIYIYWIQLCIVIIVTSYAICNNLHLKKESHKKTCQSLIFFQIPMCFAKLCQRHDVHHSCRRWTYRGEGEVAAGCLDIWLLFPQSSFHHFIPSVSEWTLRSLHFKKPQNWGGSSKKSEQNHLHSPTKWHESLFLFEKNLPTIRHPGLTQLVVAFVHNSHTSGEGVRWSTRQVLWVFFVGGEDSRERLGRRMICLFKISVLLFGD